MTQWMGGCDYTYLDVEAEPLVIIDQVLVFRQVNGGSDGKGICAWLRKFLPDGCLDVLQVLSEELDVILRAGGQHVLVGGVGEHNPVHVESVVELMGGDQAGDVEVRHEEEVDLIRSHEVGNVSHLKTLWQCQNLRKNG